MRMKIWLQSSSVRKTTQKNQKIHYFQKTSFHNLMISNKMNLMNLQIITKSIKILSIKLKIFQLMTTTSEMPVTVLLKIGILKRKNISNN